jgi:hypothetical protein
MLPGVGRLPVGLAGHATGRFGQYFEALGSDFLTAVLAHSVGAFGHELARMLGLLTIPLQDVFDRLAGGAIAQHLGEVGIPKTLTHVSIQYAPRAPA